LKKQAQNKTNFTTLGHIFDDGKIALIKTGSQLNQQGKISLKNYSEVNSLFQVREYRIQYKSMP
jgi:hypothetical protein